MAKYRIKLMLNIRTWLILVCLIYMD